MTSPSVLLEHCRERVSDAHATELLPRFAKAVERYPVAPPLLYTMGMVCLQFGYFDLWTFYTRMAFELPHVSHQDVLFRAEAKIRLDDWSGWVDREARCFNPRETTHWEPYARHVQWTTQLWNGTENITDKTILVITDGGFGDFFQMLRYIPALAGVAGAVILTAPLECLGFARSVVGHLATIITSDDVPATSFDRYTWLMSLAATIGPLHPFQAFSAPHPIRGVRSVDTRPRIGVCWAGISNAPRNFEDPHRSLSLDDLAPMLARTDIRCCSLQVGDWASDARRYPSLGTPDVPLATFADTANVMAGLDCVVTVDTSVAHLSGILGVPTFLLLHLAGDFRWGTRVVTPWYPSMRILRQHRRSDWRCRHASHDAPRHRDAPRWRVSSRSNEERSPVEQGGELAYWIGPIIEDGLSNQAHRWVPWGGVVETPAPMGVQLQ
jgi:hypothetical protein